MEDRKETICPWCQTEIVWDPEIGPEDTCPHCWNELGDYRSVNLNVLSAEEDEPDHEPDEEEDNDNWEAEAADSYGERVQQCLDEQEEAPECAGCHEFLLLAGQQTVDGTAYMPNAPAAIGGPFLKPPYTVNVYVCPSCFLMEYSLSENDRLAMISCLGQQSNE